jgi:hypothetical protein
MLAMDCWWHLTWQFWSARAWPTYIHRAPKAITAVANEKRVDRLGFDVAINYGDVRPLDVVPGEHADELFFRLGRSRKHHQAARVAIEAMDGPNAEPLPAL